MRVHIENWAYPQTRTQRDSSCRGHRHCLPQSQALGPIPTGTCFSVPGVGDSRSEATLSHCGAVTVGTTRLDHSRCPAASCPRARTLGIPPSTSEVSEALELQVAFLRTHHRLDVGRPCLHPLYVPERGKNWML